MADDSCLGCTLISLWGCRPYSSCSPASSAARCNSSHAFWRVMAAVTVPAGSQKGDGLFPSVLGTHQESGDSSGNVVSRTDCDMVQSESCTVR